VGDDSDPLLRVASLLKGVEPALGGWNKPRISPGRLCSTIPVPPAVDTYFSRHYSRMLATPAGHRIGEHR
jgi:hypothetical protein